jgi:cysteinyl-tRNA synthetase
MANYWLHNGFLQVEGEKMSKSLGNFVTIHDVLRDWPGEVTRLNMLKAHYRQPIDWTLEGLKESERTLDQWYDTIGEVAPAEEIEPETIEALNDDLNTPRFIAALHELKSKASAGEAQARGRLRVAGQLIGLFGMTAREWEAAQRAQAGVDEHEIVDFIAARAAARKAKNFAEADRIRAKLDAMGVALKDSRDPTTGELVTTWEVKR